MLKNDCLFDFAHEYNKRLPKNLKEQKRQLNGVRLQFQTEKNPLF